MPKRKLGAAAGRAFALPAMGQAACSRTSGDGAQTQELMRRALGRLEAAGLCPGGDLVDVSSRPLCELWGGMGAIMELSASYSSSQSRRLIAKVIDLPAVPKNTSERRKKKSYEVEALFYERGHAERLARAGAPCPVPLLVDKPPGDGGGRLTICMTLLPGRPARSLSDGQLRAALAWLARLHAGYWGSRADRAVEEGLQEQGCYWHLDTRLEELERWTDTEGFEGRLRRAARAVDARLKADRHQTVCHGDAKSENMLFGQDDSVSMFDFQYVGKAPPGKDLAYCLINARDLSEARQVEYLEAYLSVLRPLLEAQGDVAPSLDELRACYALSVCDLARWMVGWDRRYWNCFKGMMQPRCEPTLRSVDGGHVLESEEAYAAEIFRIFPP